LVDKVNNDAPVEEARHVLAADTIGPVQVSDSSVGHL